MYKRQPLYIGVNLYLGDVTAIKKITGTISKEDLDVLQADNYTQDLSELIINPVKELFNSISSSIVQDEDSPDTYTVHSLGFFKMYYTKGEKDRIYNRMYNYQVSQFKNFGEERAAVIKEALQQGGFGFSVKKDKSIVGAIKYFDRYKAAIEMYWDANFVNDFVFTNVNSIDTWYTESSSQKDTEAFSVNTSSSILDYTGLIFNAKSNLNTYLQGYQNLTTYGQPKIIITDTFTNSDRITQISDALNQSGYSQSFIWIHVDKTGKTLSQNIFHNGHKIDLDPSLKQRITDLGNTLFEGDISAATAVRVLFEIDAIITQFGSIVFNGIADGANALQMPKAFWDSSDPNYVFKNLQSFVQNEVAWLEGALNAVQDAIALSCGIYNGLLGTVSFASGVIGSSFDVKIFIRRLFTDSGYRDDILEQAQKITNLIADAESREVIWTVSKALVLSNIEQGWDYQWEKIESGNLTGVYYFAGNIAFEVIVGILSGGTSVTANAGKEALAILKWAIDPLEFAVKAGVKFAAPIGKLLKAGFVLAKNTVGDGISWTIKKGGKVIGELKIVAQKIELATNALIKSLDDNLSEVLAITTPEGFTIRYDDPFDNIENDILEDFGNKVLKIMKDAQGNYKVLVQGVDTGIAKLVDKLDLGNFVKKIGDYEVFENGEVFYRGISKVDFEYLKLNGKLKVTSSRSEMFTSPSLEYIKSVGYGGDGVIVKIKVKKGTLNKLEQKGIRDQSARAKILYPNMQNPQSPKGWMDKGQVYFKQETIKGTNTKQVNIGLGRNLSEKGGLKLFNDNILEFEIIN